MSDQPAPDELFPPVVETDRLRLEKTCHENVDLFELYEVCAYDEGIDEVTEPMPWDPHPHPKETTDYLDRCESQWDDGESAHFTIRPRDGEDGAGEIAGQTTLRIDWDRRVGTLGIWLRKRFWGRGYSGERAAALVALAFDRLDLEVVSVNHEVGNDRSKRAVEKYVERFGGRREGTLRNYLPFGDAPADAVRYTISRAEYRANRSDDGADALWR